MLGVHFGGQIGIGSCNGCRACTTFWTTFAVGDGENNDHHNTCQSPIQPATTTTTTTTTSTSVPAPFKWGTYVATDTSNLYQCDGGYQVITSADVCEDAAAWVAQGNNGIFTNPNPIYASYQGEAGFSHVAYGCFWDAYTSFHFNTDQTLALSNYPALCSPEEATSTSTSVSQVQRNLCVHSPGAVCSDPDFRSIRLLLPNQKRRQPQQR